MTSIHPSERWGLQQAQLLASVDLEACMCHCGVSDPHPAQIRVPVKHGAPERDF